MNLKNIFALSALLFAAPLAAMEEEPSEDTVITQPVRTQSDLKRKAKIIAIALTRGAIHGAITKGSDKLVSTSNQEANILPLYVSTYATAANIRHAFHEINKMNANERAIDTFAHGLAQGIIEGSSVENGKVKFGFAFNFSLIAPGIDFITTTLLSSLNLEI